MKSKYVAIAVIAATLVATTAITGESAWTTKYKDWIQAITQANDCGNGILPMYVEYQYAASQIQGDGNTLAINALHSSTEVEEQTPTEPLS